MQIYNEKDLDPSILSLYKKVLAISEGKDALKRLCIFCGICKSKKFYSLTRRSLKIGNMLCCDSCHNIYALQEISIKLGCNDHATGSIFLGKSLISPKCKACRLLQILSRCEMSTEKYGTLYNCLNKQCQKLIPSSATTIRPTSGASAGFMRLQYYVGDRWLDMSGDNLEGSSMDADSSSDHCSEAVEESDTAGTNPSSPVEENGYRNYEDTSASMDIYEEEAMIDDPPPLEEESHEPSKELLTSRQLKIRENLAFSVKSSERIRKKKKVDYIVGGKKHKRCIHGPDGKILKNGKDLCDCLQDHCPGCHFPCPKCRNPKCGSECRVNRRWYYDKVDIEGTNISWNNKWVQKLIK